MGKSPPSGQVENSTVNYDLVNQRNIQYQVDVDSSDE